MPPGPEPPALREPATGAGGPLRILVAQVVGAALGDGQEIVVEIAEHSARTNRVTRRTPPALRWFRAASQPVLSRPWSGPQAGCRRIRSARRQGSPAPRPGRSQSGHQAGRTGPHNQDVAVGIAMFVAVGVRCPRRCAPAGGAADEAFIKSPQLARPNKRFVLKPGGKEAANTSLIPARSKSTLGQPLMDCASRPSYSSTWVARRLGKAGRPADLHDRVRFFGAAADNAAWPVQLEAAPDQVDPISQQGRGQRVALIALTSRAVEVKAQRRERSMRPPLSTDGCMLYRPSPAGNL